MNSEQNSILKQKSLFFDTYAFYEIINGNPNYVKYEGYEIITTKLNIFELYFGLVRDGKEYLAEQSIETYYKVVSDFDKEVIMKAAILKKIMNKRDVSMVDCIGYCLAKQLGIKFLTGDKEFEGLENVEFVK